MKKNLKNTFLFLIFFLVVPYFFNSAFAAYLKFDNTTATAANGATFQLSVVIEPGSDAINSSDVYITYDQTLLNPTTVTAGTLFPTVTNDTSIGGKIYIAGMVDDPASSISTAGTIATITFKALKDGSGTLAFDCNSSKIIKNDINATNVIACSQNTGAAVTIGGGGQAAAPTNAPNELPTSGVFDNVVRFAIPGLILLILGSALKFVL